MKEIKFVNGEYSEYTTDRYKLFEKVNYPKIFKNISRAINNKVRESIINFLHESDNLEANVSEITEMTGIGQSATSQHLGILCDANIIIPRREGKFIYYKLNYESINLINEFVYKYFNSDTEKTAKNEKC